MKVRRKNVGIVLVGQLRTFLKCKNNFYKYLVNCNRKDYNIYIFFVTYRKDHEELETKLIDLPNVKDVCLIEKNFKFDPSNEFIKDLNINSIFYEKKLKRFIYTRVQWIFAKKLIEKFRSKVKLDYILLSRPDIMYYDYFSISKIEKNLKNNFFIPNEKFIHVDKNLNGVEKRSIKRTYTSREIKNFIKNEMQYFNDTIIISGRKNILDLCSLMENTNKIINLWIRYYKSINFTRLKPEAIINFYILEYCKIKIEKFFVEASTYRNKNLSIEMKNKIRKNS